MNFKFVIVFAIPLKLFFLNLLPFPSVFYNTLAKDYAPINVLPKGEGGGGGKHWG